MISIGNVMAAARLDSETGFDRPQISNPKMKVTYVWSAARQLLVSQAAGSRVTV